MPCVIEKCASCYENINVPTGVLSQFIGSKSRSWANYAQKNVKKIKIQTSGEIKPMFVIEQPLFEKYPALENFFEFVTSSLAEDRNDCPSLKFKKAVWGTFFTHIFDKKFSPALVLNGDLHAEWHVTDNIVLPQTAIEMNERCGLYSGAKIDYKNTFVVLKNQRKSNDYQFHHHDCIGNVPKALNPLYFFPVIRNDLEGVEDSEASQTHLSTPMASSTPARFYRTPEVVHRMLTPKIPLSVVSQKNSSQEFMTPVQIFFKYLNAMHPEKTPLTPGALRKRESIDSSIMIEDSELIFALTQSTDEGLKSLRSTNPIHRINFSAAEISHVKTPNCQKCDQLVTLPTFLEDVRVQSKSSSMSRSTLDASASKLQAYSYYGNGIPENKLAIFIDKLIEGDGFINVEPFGSSAYSLSAKKCYGNDFKSHSQVFKINQDTVTPFFLLQDKSNAQNLGLFHADHLSEVPENFNCWYVSQLDLNLSRALDVSRQKEFVLIDLSPSDLRFHLTIVQDAFLDILVLSSWDNAIQNLKHQKMFELESSQWWCASDEFEARKYLLAPNRRNFSNQVEIQKDLKNIHEGIEPVILLKSELEHKFIYASHFIHALRQANHTEFPYEIYINGTLWSLSHYITPVKETASFIVWKDAMKNAHATSMASSFDTFTTSTPVSGREFIWGNGSSPQAAPIAFNTSLISTELTRLNQSISEIEVFFGSSPHASSCRTLKLLFSDVKRNVPEAFLSQNITKLDFSVIKALKETQEVAGQLKQDLGGESLLVLPEDSILSAQIESVLRPVKSILAENQQPHNQSALSVPRIVINRTKPEKNSDWADLIQEVSSKIPERIVVSYNTKDKKTFVLHINIQNVSYYLNRPMQLNELAVREQDWRSSIFKTPHFFLLKKTSSLISPSFNLEHFLVVNVLDLITEIHDTVPQDLGKFPEKIIMISESYSVLGYFYDHTPSESMSQSTSMPNTPPRRNSSLDTQRNPDLELRRRNRVVDEKGVSPSIPSPSLRDSTEVEYTSASSSNIPDEKTPLFLPPSLFITNQPATQPTIEGTNYFRQHPDDKAWYRQRKYQVLIGIGILGVVSAAAGMAAFFSRSKEEGSSTIGTTSSTTIVPTSSTWPMTSSTSLTTSSTLEIISTFIFSTFSSSSSSTSTTISSTQTTTKTFVTYDPTISTIMTTTGEPWSTFGWTGTISSVASTTNLPWSTIGSTGTMPSTTTMSTTTSTTTTTTKYIPPAQVRQQSLKGLKNTWAVLRKYRRVEKDPSVRSIFGTFMVGEDHYRDGFSIKPFYGPFMPQEWKAFQEGLFELCGEDCQSHKGKIINILDNLNKGNPTIECPPSWVFMKDIKPVSDTLGSPNSLASLIASLISNGAMLCQVLD